MTTPPPPGIVLTVCWIILINGITSTFVPGGPDNDPTAKKKTTSARHLIAGGFDVIDPTRFSYYTRLPQGEDHFCGGSLVAPDMLLTSAACSFENLDEVEVTVGWRSTVEEAISILGVYTHPEFIEETLENAFSLIKLANASINDILILSESPIGTEPDDSSVELTVLGSTVTRITPTLASVPITTSTNEACRASKNDGGFPILVGESQFCAGDENRGFCHDDYGGPLIIPGENVSTVADVQVGVAAWTFCGITGGRIGKSSPGVYLRVSDGFDWIRTIICNYSDSAPSYLDCPNSTIVVSQSTPASPPAAESPIIFRYEVSNDGFLFEVGIMIEKIIDLETIEVVHYVVPGALLTFSAYAEATLYVEDLELERDALYAFSIVDGEADGVVADLTEGIGLYLQDDNGQFERVTGKTGGFGARSTVLFYAALDFVSGSFFFRPTFEGEQFIYLDISFDEYPWEIGVELLNEDGTRIWFSPPRFYEVPLITVREKISIPPIPANYVLIVSDTLGDGLGPSGDTGIRMFNREEEALGTPESFETGSLVSILVEYEIVTYAPTSEPTFFPTISTDPPSSTRRNLVTKALLPLLLVLFVKQDQL